MTHLLLRTCGNRPANSSSTGSRSTAPEPYTSKVLRSSGTSPFEAHAGQVTGPRDPHGAALAARAGRDYVARCDHCVQQLAAPSVAMAARRLAGPVEGVGLAGQAAHVCLLGRAASLTSLSTAPDLLVPHCRASSSSQSRASCVSVMLTMALRRRSASPGARVVTACRLRAPRRAPVAP